MQNAGPAGPAPSGGNGMDDDGAPGEATLLVSEFPPPPSYHHLAASLTPPPIPKEALERGTLRAAAAAARARAEAERIRLADDADKTDAILGGVPANEEEEEADGDVVAVFGEIVEDPMIVQPLDPCENPRIVGNEIKRLNQQVVEGFIALVQELVHRPAGNKEKRDELSHKIFLMLQECNKLREHQSRELLIQLLEHQLEERKSLTKQLGEDIEKAESLLNKN
eukprot:CAMPEP_0198120560 /NCGR_PEP_ID=MMETSP1442-20131203/29468_1 /TAXON_ID= /ORGANISM="Craspedostauros australis, Strain CCMP3328" /LENGTH=223 /DNA_ID=CAMNT_0043779225 /DNA_START=198 /DNA_END=869 /DNA_ORIENTATION=-